MIDISNVLIEAGQLRRSRSSTESEKLLGTVNEAINGQVCWDEAAGEDWATVMVGESIAAHVLMLAPLVVVRETDLAKVRAAAGDDAAVIAVPDMDQTILRADRRALDELFGERVGELEASQFSATDLWFHSI